MVQWFVVEKATREVSDVGRGDVVPADTATQRFIETSPQSIRRYQKKKSAADDVALDGIPITVLYSDGDFVTRKGMSWMSVDKATNRVTGTVRSSKARQPPPDDASTAHVEMTEAQENQLRTLRDQAKLAGRSPSEIEWDGTSVLLPADTRNRYRVASDLAVVDVGSSITLTVTALRRNGSVNTGISGEQILALADRRVRLTFVAGIAVKTLVARESGFMNFAASPEFDLESSLDVEVVE